MASLSAAAIVVSHARPDLLEKTLSALAALDTKPLEVLVVETSANLDSKNLADRYSFKFLSLSSANFSQSIDFAIENLSQSVQWLWILHDDCAPEAGALQALLRTAETSPSVAIVGPKLLEANDPRVIQQLGLTTTWSGRPFVLVQEEYDQGQHDRVADVMATSTAGMLVSLGVWQKLGGLNSEAPTLAQDLDFGIRVRTAGYRVIVEPQARVLHHGLSLKGERGKKWLGGGWATALAKSENYLATLLLPNWLATLRLLFLPLIAIVSIPVHIYAKKPARIYASFLSWIWTWLLLPKILRGRKRLRLLGRSNVLRNLYATPAQIKRRKEAKLEYVSTTESIEQTGFFASGAIWATVLPLLASYNWFPTGPAVKLGSTPLIAPGFNEWLTTVSANLVPGFNGEFVTMDPFSWALGIFAIVNPGAPSQALAMFLMLAPALAFASSWKLFAHLNKSRLLVTFLALAYSTATVMVRSMGGLYLAVLAVALPLAIWALLRALSAETASRSWRWTGLAGLSLAIIGITSPVLFAVLIVFGLVLAAMKRQRFFAPFLASIPGLMLLAPYLLATSNVGDWVYTFEQAQFVRVENAFVFFLVLVAPLAALALMGLFRARVSTGLFLTSFVAVNLLLGLTIPSSSNQLGFWLAAFLGLTQLALELVGKIRKTWLGILVTAPVLVWVALLGISTGLFSSVTFAEARNVPALIEAANATGEEVRTLRVEVQTEQVLAHLILGNDRQLHETSYLGSRTEISDTRYQELLSSIAARVASGNSADLEALTTEARLDFILIADSETGSEVSVAGGLQTMSFLQPAGDTEFGKLFRVNNSDATKALVPEPSLWSVWQFGALAAFALLAIPTPASIFGTRRRLEGTNGDES